MKRAFSLVELLVVIAIIFTLASILMPVGAQSKERAVQTNCISNLRQVYLALKLYEEDFGDYPHPKATDYAEDVYLKTSLLCPAAQGSSHNSFIEYVAYARYGMDYEADWKRCRDVRGPEMPIGFDLHHGRAPYVIDGTRWERHGWTGLILREGGSIQRIAEDALMRARNPHLFPTPPSVPCEGYFTFNL